MANPRKRTMTEQTSDSRKMSSCIAVDKRLNTSLIQAVLRGDAERVKELIEAGADANTANLRYPVIFIASIGGKADILRMLINAGADLNAAVESDGCTALMAVVSRGLAKMFRILVAAGADVNAATESGETTLICAVQNNQVEMVLMLLEAGANLKAVDNEGYTAIDWAIRQEYTSIVEILTGVVIAQRQAAMQMAFYLRNDVNSFFYHAPKDILEHIIGPMVNYTSESELNINPTLHKSLYC